MKIQILSPEELLFKGEIDSVILPGVAGSFHILKDHAALVSTLTKGFIKVYTKSLGNIGNAKLQKTDFGFTYNLETDGIARVKDNMVEILITP